MLYFFAADIHGNLEALDKLLSHYAASGNQISSQKLCLLGDLCNLPSSGLTRESTVSKIIHRLHPISADIIAVKGNNDSDLLAALYPFDLTKRYRSISIEGGLQFFLTHGDMSYPESLYDQHDLIASGHTHKPHLYKEQDRWWLNPGSVGLPRGPYPATFALYNTRTCYAQIRDLSSNELLFQEKIRCL